ncbi:hypothetical protein GW796_07865 [archaeon]|nr:hypothetical protein [archaeon]
MDIITNKDIVLTVLGAGIGAFLSYYYAELASKKEKQSLKNDNLNMKEELAKIKKHVTLNPIIDPKLMFQDESYNDITSGIIDGENYICVKRHDYKVLKVSYIKDGGKEIIILFSIGNHASPELSIEEIVEDLFGEKIPDNVLLYECLIFSKDNKNIIKQFLDEDQEKDKTRTEEHLRRIVLECIVEIKRQFLEFDGIVSLYNEKKISENLKKQVVEDFEITKENILNSKISAWNFRG